MLKLLAWSPTVRPAIPCIVSVQGSPESETADVFIVTFLAGSAVYGYV